MGQPIRSSIRLARPEAGLRCAVCARGLSRYARFCPRCGVAAPGTRGPAVAHTRFPQEEFRRVAILFADLEGSTALAEALESEAAYRLVSETVAGLALQVVETGGFVVKTLGDGLMALFGAPRARGDDPKRAAEAALRMQEWVRARNAERPVPLQLRVGLNYGSVVAGSLAAEDRRIYDAVGDAVNVAQRMEASALPGTISVTESFYRLTRGGFLFEDLGAARVKGRSEPLHTYRLVGRRARPVEHELRLPLVGRDEAVAAIQEAVEQAQARGRPRLLLHGAEGSGKSRLLDELESRLSEAGISVLRAAGTAGGSQSPLGIWRSWLLDLLPLQPGASVEEGQAALDAALAGSPAARWTGWLARIALDPRRLVETDPETRERSLAAALHAFLAHWRGTRPGGVLIDDAHLLDSLSASVLHRLPEGSGEPGLLIAVTAPAGTAAPAGFTAIPVPPLDPPAVAQLAGAALPGVELGLEAVARLTERTGGLPLYLTLILAAAREAPDPVSVLDAVPPTLYGLVQAQLDALAPSEKPAAQTAAVLGTRFAQRWLERRLSPAETDPPPWEPLEVRGLLVEEQSEPHRELGFRHGAFREVLYSSMLSRQRQEEHCRLAGILAAEAAERPELSHRVYHHFREGGEDAAALLWALRAADYAAGVYALPEARELYSAAAELARSRQSRAELATALAGLGEVAGHQGDFPSAVESYRAAAGLLDQPDGPRAIPAPLEARVRVGFGRLLGRIGRTDEALAAVEAALARLAGAEDDESARAAAAAQIELCHLLGEAGRLPDAVLAGHAARKAAAARGWRAEQVAAGAALGVVLPLFGNWPEAERVLREAVAVAEEAGDAKGASGALINLGNGLRSAGRLDEAARSYQRALELAERIQDAEKAALVALDLGAVHLNRGDWAAAEAAFRQAREEFHGMGHPRGRAYADYNLAETFRLAGDRSRAWEQVARAEESLRETQAPPVAVHLALTHAELRLDDGDLAGVRPLLDDAARLCLQHGYDLGLHHLRLTRARLHLLEGRPDRAELEAVPAVQGFRDSREPLEECRARALLREVYRARGDSARAAAEDDAVRQQLTALGSEGWRPLLLPEGAPA